MFVVNTEPRLITGILDRVFRVLRSSPCPRLTETSQREPLKTYTPEDNHQRQRNPNSCTVVRTFLFLVGLS